MAMPVLLNGSESLTVKIKNWTRIQAAEMKVIISVEGCNIIE
jgi:hypothetical protein